jgi:RNA polymerase sigma factor (sigma-70 family)
MGSSADPSDGELLAATGRDPEAFGLFYRRYERLLLMFMLQRTGDPELAADLTAEVFAAALRAASRYRPHAPTAAAWLLTIAQRTLSSSRRKGRVEARARRRVGIREPVVLSEDDLQRIDALCSLDGRSLALLDELPVNQREAVRAHVLDERSYSEIADKLETSELVIRKRVSRGLSRIKSQLKEPT